MFSVTTLKHQGPCGYGVFARRDLEPGEPIFIETTQSREARCSWTKEQFDALPEKLQARVHHFGFELPNHNLAVMSWIAPYVTGQRDEIPWEDRPDNGEFFNHCCNPNAWWRDDFHLVARVRIPAGTEITYDYCTEDMDVAPFTCACGAGCCRTSITRQDWARPDLWASYGTHWKSHILDCIRAHQAKLGLGDTFTVPLTAEPATEPPPPTVKVETDDMAPHFTGDQTTVPPHAITWGYQDTTATSANGGGKNRTLGAASSVGGGGCDTATTDTASSASELDSASLGASVESDSEVLPSALATA